MSSTGLLLLTRGSRRFGSSARAFSTAVPPPSPTTARPSSPCPALAVTKEKEEAEPKAKKSLMEHVKANGITFVGYYALTWACTGALVYGGINLLGPDFTLNALKQVGVDQWVDLSAVSPESGNLMSAVVVNELLEPVRLPLVLLAVSKHKPKPRNPNPSWPVKQWYALSDTAKTYGKFFLVYYTGVWITTGVLCVGAIEYVGSEAALGLVNNYFSIDTSRFSPQFVNAGVGLAINELIEPIRFPFGVLTVKPAFKLYQKFTAK